jgi:hypothetical protein
LPETNVLFCQFVHEIHQQHILHGFAIIPSDMRLGNKKLTVIAYVSDTIREDVSIKKGQNPLVFTRAVRQATADETLR